MHSEHTGRCVSTLQVKRGRGVVGAWWNWRGIKWRRDFAEVGRLSMNWRRITMKYKFDGT